MKLTTKLLATASSILILLTGCSAGSVESLESKQLRLSYDAETWTVENQSDASSTLICFTIGDSKSSDIGLVVEAYRDLVAPADLMDYYKTSFAETMEGRDMSLASQAGTDKAWASLSGVCTESTKSEEMQFEIQATATEFGTYVTTLMYVPGTDTSLVESANAIIDSIVQLPVDESQGDYSEETLDTLTDEELASLSWDELVQVMKQTFEYVKFNVLEYHDGAYTAISLAGEEPTDAGAARNSEGQGIIFSQALHDNSELSGRTLQEFLEAELDVIVTQNTDIQDGRIVQISQSEDGTQAAGIYTYFQNNVEYFAVITVQSVGTDAWVYNSVTVDGSNITEATEQAFYELCVLLQIQVAWGDVENESAIN